MLECFGMYVGISMVCSRMQRQNYKKIVFFVKLWIPFKHISLAIIEVKSPLSTKIYIYEISTLIHIMPSEFYIHHRTSDKIIRSDWWIKIISNKIESQKKRDGRERKTKMKFCAILKSELKSSKKKWSERKQKCLSQYYSISGVVNPFFFSISESYSINSVYENIIHINAWSNGVSCKVFFPHFFLRRKAIDPQYKEEKKKSAHRMVRSRNEL